MTSKTIYKLNINCSNGTDITTHTGWYEELSNVCPNNDPTHTWIENIILETISPDIKMVVDDNTGTNGFYKCEGYTFNVGTGPNSDYQIIGDCVHPYPVRIYVISILPTSDNIGDYIEMVSAPDTTIGILTQPVNGGTALYVNSTVISHINLGLRVSLSDDNISEELGECVAIDTINNIITVSQNVTNSFNIGDKVKITLVRVSNFPITSTNCIKFGSNTIGSTYAPPGTIGRILYKNMSNTSKTFSFMAEMTY